MRKELIYLGWVVFKFGENWPCYLCNKSIALHYVQMFNSLKDSQLKLEFISFSASLLHISLRLFAGLSLLQCLFWCLHPSILISISFLFSKLLFFFLIGLPSCLWNTFFLFTFLKIFPFMRAPVVLFGVATPLHEAIQCSPNHLWLVRWMKTSSSKEKVEIYENYLCKYQFM